MPSYCKGCGYTRVGIPSGLFYYRYYPLWKSFYEELGAEVITSGGTNKNIFDLGIRQCVDEACLPVKVYHGHVAGLCGKVDAIFVPRIMSICKNEYICPKFCGLPEMIKNSVSGIPYLIDTTVNLRKGKASLADSVIEAGSVITRDKKIVLKAYEKALSIQKSFLSRLRMSGDFDFSISDDGSIRREEPDKRKKIGLIGHPYNMYDSFVNMNIMKKLKESGFDVITPEMLEPARIDSFAEKFPKRHFWTLGRIILGTGLSLMADNDVAGIIYLSSFGCGIDSLMEDYLERQIRRDGRVPYMKLVFDEHTGEAGMDTRLEAFIDMIRWREDDEGNFSSYGRSLCSGQGIS